MDSPAFRGSRFKYFGAYSAQMAVASRWIVERFNVFINFGRGNFPIFVDSLFDTLFLQTAEEGFGARVIRAISLPVRTWFETVRFALASPIATSALGGISQFLCVDEYGGHLLNALHFGILGVLRNGLRDFTCVRVYLELLHDLV